jgi:hypothetical protein
MRSDWTALPEAVARQVADRVGVFHAVAAFGGDHVEIAAAVTGTAGTVFVKAAHSDLGIWSLRYELRVGEVLKPPHSPAVRWYVEADGWLVAGFEQLDGLHADLSPGSPDLGQLASAIHALGSVSEPDLPLFSPAVRLGFTHPAMKHPG